MRRALVLVLLLLPAFPRPARSSTIFWKASASVAENRMNVSWETCPPGTREWEAFLSLDGGRSFPLRVTPHLRASVRSFSWPIPWIFADDAKLRIRFGDGNFEREYDVEGGWPLVPGGNSRPLLPESRDFAAGPAPGEEETAAWVEWNGARPRMVVPESAPGARSSSEWRAAEIPKPALPSRKLAPARPAARDGNAPPPAPLPSPVVLVLLRPSLSAFSRLNV